MATTLTEFKAKALSVAAARGLSVTDNILIVVQKENSTEDPAWVIVAHQEPVSDTAPLNVTWIVADPGHAQYGEALKRSSRANGGAFLHTWALISTYDEIITPPQFWDFPKPSDFDAISHYANISNPHATEGTGGLTEEGGQLTGPLLARVLDVAADPDVEFAQEEFIPRSFMEWSLASLRSLVLSVQNGFNYFGREINKLKIRVAALEAGIGTLGFNHIQETAALAWSVTHALETDNVLVQVQNDSGSVVYPADIKIVDANNVSILFAVPVLGEAQIRPVS